MDWDKKASWWTSLGYAIFNPMEFVLWFRIKRIDRKFLPPWKEYVYLVTSNKKDKND